MRSEQLQSTHHSSEKGHSALGVEHFPSSDMHFIPFPSLAFASGRLSHPGINSFCILGLAVSLITQPNYCKISYSFNK